MGGSGLSSCASGSGRRLDHSVAVGGGVFSRQSRCCCGAGSMGDVDQRANADKWLMLGCSACLQWAAILSSAAGIRLWRCRETSGPCIQRTARTSGLARCSEVISSSSSLADFQSPSSSQPWAARRWRLSAWFTGRESELDREHGQEQRPN